jgi:hypothetical protein
MFNIGNVERMVRVLVGILLISLVFVGPKTAWGFLGFVPLLTGLAGSCPAYRLFGLSRSPFSPHKGSGTPA